MEEYLWNFYWDCGRQGNVEGLFVATEEEVKNSIGREAYFGEILGKHSEIYGAIEEGEITKVDLDTETVRKTTEVLGKNWSGYNPLDYVHYCCEKCGDKYLIEEFDVKKNICNYCAEEDNND